jgi:hypothetical protein
MRKAPAKSPDPHKEERSQVCMKQLQQREAIDECDLGYFDGTGGFDHGAGHFRPLSITRQRHLLAYHSTARSHASLCQVF